MGDRSPRWHLLRPLCIISEIQPEQSTGAEGHRGLEAPIATLMGPASPWSGCPTEPQERPGNCLKDDRGQSLERAKDWKPIHPQENV